MIIMNKLLVGAAAFMLLPLPAQAGQILPNLYARAYCESRAIGMTVTAAMTQATDESYISSGNPQQVDFNGTTTTTDVVAAIRAAYKRCPQYF